MTDDMPDENQLNQAAIAQEEFSALITRLNKEGLHYHSLLAGAACALAQSLIVNGGASKASAWFAGQAGMVEYLAAGQGRTN